MKTRTGSSHSLVRTIPSRLEDAEDLFLQIRNFTQSCGPSYFCFAVELMARECVVNAIVHGNRSIADKSVELRLQVGRKWLRMQVTDQGSGFPWRKILRRRTSADSCNGRGLQLCRVYANHLRFNRQGNRIELWIKRARKGDV